MENQKLKELYEEERKTLALQDAKEKAKGSTHKIVVWIHPVSGDDYRVDIYFPHEPTQQDITISLKESIVKDDYVVEVL